MGDGTYLQKFGAYWGLVCIQFVVSLLTRVASDKGQVNFSPASAFVMAEGVKCLLSVSFILSSSSHGHLSWVYRIRQELSEGANSSLVIRSGILGLLYCVNNNLQFYLYMYSDGATVFLFKSFSTIIATLLLRVFVSRQISSMQWLAVFLQVMGLIVVVYDPCKGAATYEFWVYSLIVFSVMLTSISSVVNEILLKGNPASMHVQNMILYSFGVVFNSVFYVLVPPPGKKNQVGFFENYGVVAVCIVLANGFVGLAITAVYKYADVLVKTFATASITCLLMIVDITFYEVPFNLTKFMGAGVVFVATYVYLEHRIPVTPAAPRDIESQSKPMSVGTSANQLTSCTAANVIVGTVLCTYLVYLYNSIA